VTDFTTIFLWIAGAILTAASSLLGWFVGLLFKKFKEQSDNHVRLEDKMERVDTSSRNRDDHLEEAFNKHRFHAAETFTTKTDVKEMKDDLVGFLIRIEQKLDRKADKN